MNKCILTVAALISAANAFCATVAVVAPQEGAAKSVTVGGKASAVVDAGKTAAIKATANAGWVFAGWYTAYDAETAEFSGEAVLDKAADWRSPSANFKAGDEDVTLYARFVTPAEDSLAYDLAETFAEATDDYDDLGRPVLSLANALDLAVAVESHSFPTLAVSGLPAGLSFDKSSLRITGKPKSPGVYKITVSGKNASGYSYSQVAFVRVENMTAEHIDSYDVSDMTAGVDLVDGYLDSFFYIYNTNAVLKSVALSGLPSGLTLNTIREHDEVYYYISGAPKAAGEYVVICKATFGDGTTESASALFTVNALGPFDYGVDVDFSVLEGWSVGSLMLEEDEFVLGEYDSGYKVGVTSVSGLPTGIVAKKVASEDGTVRYVLGGMFSKAGEFTVSVKIAYDDWESGKIATATLAQKIIVSDTVGSYLSVGVLDPNSAPGCKASGSGVYAAGSAAKLTATAGNGYVFAGWCDSAGLLRLVGTEDYRKSPVSVAIGADTELEWYANFIPKGSDYVDISELDGAELEFDALGYDVFSATFAVDSGSLPTLKFSNLPSGMMCVPSVEIAGEYVLSYNPTTAKQKPSPGRYTVTATATNASRLSDLATFTITVKNIVDDDIHVEDDYGVLTPNVAMEPISFSNAVDFARGDTLVVSGLPQGLKFDDKTAPYCLSGIPAKPGEYTIAFKAKIVTSVVTNEATGRVTFTYRGATATAFVKVKDFPTIAAEISDDAAFAGCKVLGVGSFKAGTKVTLKAAAATDWVFAGWSGLAGVEGLAALSPTLSYVMGADDLTEIEAAFIHRRDDVLTIGDPGVVAVVKGDAFSTNLVEELIETRSFPTVTVTGLPTGLKFDAKSLLISGSVGQTAKAGYVYVTVTAKNASGYTFTRVLKFAVLDAGGEDIPEEPALANDAGIDFSDFDELVTGDFYPKGNVASIGFTVYPATNGAAVTAVAVIGLPVGLNSATSIEDDVAEVEVFGTPTKPGRYEIKVQVTYSDRKKATSQYAFIVADGGSGWLDVDSFDTGAGTVSGSGVYASGALVKLAAKPANGNVFAGWYEDEGMPFGIMAETDGIDYRTAAASFIFRKGMFASVPSALYGDFVAKADDVASIDGLDELWEIDPAVDAELPFVVNSASFPKLSASGLPKGVTLDSARGRFVYSSVSQAQVVPGYYSVTLKAVNQSNVSVAATLPVFVANKTSDLIGGLDPAADAYPVYAGVSIDPELIMPEVEVTNGWKLTVAGLPAGLKLVQDGTTGAYSVSGVATKAGTNTVTFTAAKGKDKEIATITVGVVALPNWAAGTYDGAYFEFDEDCTNVVGQVTATVSESGKVSGKVLKDGKAYAFSAASYETYDADSAVFSATVTIPWSATNREVFVFYVGVGENGLGIAKLEPVGDGAHLVQAVQNAWLRKDISVPVFAAGAKQPVLNISSSLCCGLEPSYDLVCKFGANGVVSISGNVNGGAVTGKAQTLLRDCGEAPVEAVVVVYIASAKIEGGAYCKIVEVDLSDEDGDGKVDTAQLIEGD